MKKNIRVRFAPSPTGFMHLGNVRAAFMNYLFARQNKGTLVLRIEDTDVKRNLEESPQKIVDDLRWLGLFFNEGYKAGGDFGPYIQSQRTEKYQQALMELDQNQQAYRCFCSVEELEEKRQKQKTAGLPPRYDRTCLRLSREKIKQKIAFGKGFIWRFKINEIQILEITDMAKGKIAFDMGHYGDFALTRQDGSVTFTFANFVDDWLMKITHVIRGQDNLSNTAYQVALYHAFAVAAPIFWHLPIICNTQGEKMSKRDFGFALKDLSAAGYIPEAILNYLAIIGTSFEEEIQSLEQLTKNYNFNKISSGGNIHHDEEKLRWINHKWLTKLLPQELLTRVKPMLQKSFLTSNFKKVEEEKLLQLVGVIQPELKSLNEVPTLTQFFFEAPKIDKKIFAEKLGAEKMDLAIKLIQDGFQNSSASASASFSNKFIQKLKQETKAKNLSVKEVFMSLRYLLTGSFSGIGIKDLIDLLKVEEIKKRIIG
jgi:nondiscriminating glutamyl-tRNA synthetase